MNKIYGFEGEVKHKYDDTVMALFTEVFNWLPIAAVISSKPVDAGAAWADVPLKSVFVVHGGLSTNVADPPAGSEHKVGAVTLAAINDIARGREPPESGLMADLLWSDPQPLLGRAFSKVRKAAPALIHCSLHPCHSLSPSLPLSTLCWRQISFIPSPSCTWPRH
jgi:serine/threonine-protein phosphatase 5